MNEKQVKKLKKIYNKELTNQAREQAKYIRLTLKPCPKNKLGFKVWIFFARFYFTKNHIEAVKKSYARIKRK